MNRVVDYLRISVTDRCNERCLYCMPEQFHDWKPREEILSYEEILAIVEAAVARGFRHFRVTGGEPLLRAAVDRFLHDLVHTRGVESVQVSTNGTRLPAMARDLYAAGLRRLNISLDALDPAVYRAITHGELAPVLAGIRAARDVGFPSIRLNTVLIRHKNEGEIWPLIQFAAELQVPIRFIELMPVSLTEMLTEENFLPIAEVQAMISERDELVPVEAKIGHGPARYYRLRKTGALVGFIGAPHEPPLLRGVQQGAGSPRTASCAPCLGHHGEIDLKPALRPQVDPAALRARLDQALAEKPPEHEFRNNWQPQRIMTAIGG